MSIISNYSIENNIVKFKLNNTNAKYKISFTNALRRILISYIDCYAIDFNDIEFIENNSLFNNEFLKKRLSLIPIISNNNHNYEFIQVFCQAENDKEIVKDVYVSDFKIKDRTIDKELKISDFFSDMDILFSKLQFEQKINFECNLKKNNAFEGGSSFSPVSSCVVTFENSNYSKDTIEDRERNYDLNSKNEPKTYDFYYENIGFFKSEELIKIAIDVLVKKLNDFKIKFDNIEYNSDFYYFTINNENDTIGNLFCRYFLDKKEITYCGYNIVHPLKNDIIIKIKIDDKKDKLLKLIQEQIEELINLAIDLKKQFK